MTNISGFVTDVGLVGSHGRLIIQAVEFYGDGEEVLVPSPVSFPIAAGVVSANVSPGAARLTIHVGSSRREWFVNVPATDVGLGTLIESFSEYEPPVVSAAIAARDAARIAATAAEASRVGAEAAHVATVGFRDSAEGYRDDAVAARGGAESARDGSVAARDAAQGSASAASGSASTASSAASAAESARAGAVSARGGAESAASSAGGAASAAAGSANRAETAANEFDLTVTSSTGAPGSSAAVTVSGDGPAYSLGFVVPQGPKGDKGDEGEISQAQLDAAVASLVANAPEALNTLDELASALGDDPNFATTVSTQIGERAKTSDVNAALAGKAATSHTHPVSDVSGLQATLDGKAATSHTHSTAQVTGLDDALAGKASTSHTHPVADLSATGTRSASTYLRGDGSWATPADTNTTYSIPTQAEAEAGTATTARAFSAQRVRQAIDARAITKQGAASGLWIGTTASLPTTGTAGVLYVTTN